MEGTEILKFSSNEQLSSFLLLFILLNPADGIVVSADGIVVSADGIVVSADGIVVSADGIVVSAVFVCLIVSCQGHEITHLISLNR